MAVLILLTAVLGITALGAPWARRRLHAERRRWEWDQRLRKIQWQTDLVRQSLMSFTDAMRAATREFARMTGTPPRLLDRP